MCTNFEMASVILEIGIVREPATTRSWSVTPDSRPCRREYEAPIGVRWNLGFRMVDLCDV